MPKIKVCCAGVGVEIDTNSCGCEPTGPGDLPGLVLWLDAEVGLTLDGNKVTRWADRSPSKNDAVQDVDSFGTHEPTLSPTPVNGRQCVNFAIGDPDVDASAATQRLSLAEPASLGFDPSANDEFEFLAVVRANVGAALQDRYFFTKTTFSTQYAAALSASGDGSDKFGFGYGTSIPVLGSAAAELPRAAAGIVGGRATSSGYHIGRAAGADGQTVPNGPNTASGFDTLIGARRSLNNDFAQDAFDGDICELIVFGRVLTTQERQSMESYLTGRWIGS